MQEKSEICLGPQSHQMSVFYSLIEHPSASCGMRTLNVTAPVTERVNHLV